MNTSINNGDATMAGHHPTRSRTTQVNCHESANSRIQKNVKVVRGLMNELHEKFAEFELMTRNGTGNFGDVGRLAHIRECLNECLSHEDIAPE